MDPLPATDTGGIMATSVTVKVYFEAAHRLHKTRVPLT